MKFNNIFVSFVSVCLLDFKNINKQAGLIQEYNIIPDFTGENNILLSMIISLLKKYFKHQKAIGKNEKIILILGLGKLNFDFIKKNYYYNKKNQNSEFWDKTSFYNLINFSLDIEIKKEFPMINKIVIISASCVTGIYATYLGIQHLEEFDKCIIVCAEKSKNDLLISGYKNMGVLSKQGIMRPFSKNRDGFVPGEGAGLMVIEKFNNKVNSEKYLGKINSIIVRNDAYDIVKYKNDGENISFAIKEMLENSQLKTNDIDYINAHGTATVYNDFVETKVYKKVFGSHAKNLYISSVKPFFGHCLSASGLIETIISFISLKHEYLFPTMNFFAKDDFCDLNYVFEKGINKKIKNFIKLSLGFGGTIGAITGERY